MKHQTLETILLSKINVAGLPHGTTLSWRILRCRWLSASRRKFAKESELETDAPSPLSTSKLLCARRSSLSEAGPTFPAQP